MLKRTFFRSQNFLGVMFWLPNRHLGVFADSLVVLSQRWEASMYMFTDLNQWRERIPITDDFPVVTLHKSQSESYHVLDWQKLAVKLTLQHYLRAFYALTVCFIPLWLMWLVSNKMQCSSLNSGSVNSETLLIQTGDYGPCWFHCIYILHLRQIPN